MPLPRFRIRTLMIVVAAVAMVAAGIGWIFSVPERHQHAAYSGVDFHPSATGFVCAVVAAGVVLVIALLAPYCRRKP